MRLTLRVLSFCGNPPETPIESDFERYPVVIGRSSSCDFVLEDASKYISSTHAIIVLENNQLMIQDTSSNGAYINGSTASMGRGNSVALTSGDSLTVGDYVLSIALDTRGDVQIAAKAPQPETVDPFDPFRDQDHDWTPPSQAAAVDNFWGDDDQLPTPSTSPSNSDWDDWPDLDTPSTPDRAAASPAKAAQRIPDELDWLPGVADETVSAPTPIQHAGAVPIAPQPPEFRQNQRTPNAQPDKALACLLRGAGLDARNFAHVDSEQILESAGKILSQSVDGMMLLLQSRAELKNAIRTDVTRLNRSNNNPLKFSHSANDALSKLLDPHNSKGYQQADDAINEAVDDLKAHQLAMLDGMKAAVRAMLLQFDPDVLEKKLESANPIAANIPITREAKLWQIFNERFNDIHDEAMHDFKELFGKEFRKAYDKRIRALGHEPDF